MPHISFTRFLLLILLTCSLSQCSKNNIFEQHLQLEIPQNQTLAPADKLTPCYTSPSPKFISREDLLLTESDIVRPEFLTKHDAPSHITSTHENDVELAYKKAVDALTVKNGLLASAKTLQQNNASIPPIAPQKPTKQPLTEETALYHNKQANPNCYPFRTHYMHHILTTHHYYQANRLSNFLHKFFKQGDNASDLTAFLQEQGAQCHKNTNAYYTDTFCNYEHSTFFPTEWHIKIRHQKENPQLINFYQVTLSAQDLGS